MQKKLGYVAIGLLLATVAGSAWGQQSPVPLGIDPSQVGREINPSQPPPSTQDRPRVNIETPKRGVTVDPRLASRRVTINRVVIEGVEGFRADDLAEYFRPLLDKEVPLTEVAAAVNRIAQRYEAEGYVFYNVLLPNQDFAGGVLRVVVIEGSITEVVINGIDSAWLKDLMMRFAGKLVDRRPLRRATLERYLLLINDIPGMQTKYALQTSTTTLGGLKLVIDASMKKFEGIANVDNYQSVPGIGINVKLGAIANSLVNLGESTELRWLFATPFGRLHLIDARESIPVDGEGGRLDFIFQYVIQNPEFIVNNTPLDFPGRSIYGRVQYRLPVLRTVKHTVNAFVAFDVIRSEFELEGIPLPGDRLAVVRAGATYTGTDPWDGVWGVLGQASFGLDVFDAQAVNRVGDRTNFIKFNGIVQRAQELFPTVTAVGKISGQYALTTVPLAEVFSYGGRDFGRGFNSFESIGDYGFTGGLELRWAPDFVPIDRKLFDFHFYVFGDYGWVRSLKSANQPSFDEGASVGAGIRFKILDKGTAEIEGAKPLLGRVASQSSNQQHWRVFFRVGVTY